MSHECPVCGDLKGSGQCSTCGYDPLEDGRDDRLRTDGGQEQGMDSRFRDREKALEAARQSGKTERTTVVCPQCGRGFQNLPHHLPCDGKEGSS